MSLFTRRERPPAEVVAGLADDERVVSWADTADDQVVVATPKGVWWPDPDGPRRIPWQFIDKAIWRDGVLSIIEADLVDDLLLEDRPPVMATLSRPRDLPPTIRKRVEANIVRSELLTIGGGAVRFVGRRLPGRDGVSWWARLEPGTRDTERVRAAIRARLAILRAD
ncbi:MAG: hypothetical protein QOG01_2855 [Pseudonocardiales bacterium]|jgi:hypothetical protein|nr:hypothetical protein [Pseudonocardiales bacterium]